MLIESIDHTYPNFAIERFEPLPLLIATVVLTFFCILTIAILITILVRQHKLKLEYELQRREMYKLKYESKNDYRIKILQLERVLDEENQFLTKIANLSIDEAKNKLKENLRFKYRNYYNAVAKNEKKAMEENLNLQAQEILISSIEGLLSEEIIQRTSTTIKLPDDNIKGKIIGKDGKNKRRFEELTGVDLIIEKQPEVTLSCTNPIRRQLAKNLMNQLLSIKNIEINRIESLYESEKLKLTEDSKKIGKKTLEDTLQIYEFYDEKMYELIGNLAFRYSYGQNVLHHCIECSRIAVAIAEKIKLDPEKAKRAAFFHDIGKSKDFEEGFDHVKCGIEIANEFNFPEYIKNAIESHHNKVEPTNVYSALAKIADEISASRPGARIDSYEEHIKHIVELETIAMSFPEVIKAYGMRSGRILRVIVQPDKTSDDRLEALAYDIVEKIENNSLTNLHSVKVIILREQRIELTTNVDPKNKK